MRVLVVGGLGYLGSIISDIIKGKNPTYEVEILDNAIWNNMNVIKEIKSMKHHLAKETVDGNFDVIIFCCIPDEENFISMYPKYMNKIKLLLGTFSQRTKHIMLCSTYQLCYANSESTTLKDYFHDLEEDVLEHDGTIIRIPSLHGPSPRMRWDTIANEIFLSLYVNNGCILKSNWRTQILLASVLDTALFIEDQIKSKNKTPVINYYTQKMNALELAHVIKNTIQTDCTDFVNMVVDTKDLDEAISIGSKDIAMVCTHPITKSVTDIITNLKKGNLPDFMSDSYNNAAITNSAEIFRNFIAEVGEK